MRQLLAAIFVIAISQSAQAIPVQFDFNSQCCGTQGSTIPGTASGQAFNISIFADNGGTSTLSQTWGLGDYVSASASIGGTVYTMALDIVASGFNAATDAAGNVLAMSLDDFTGNSDNLGSSSPGLIVNGFRNIIFTGNNGVADADLPTIPANWTVGQSGAVPAPATLALFGLGLAGLGWSRRKKA